MTEILPKTEAALAPAEVARRFVTARRAARALAGFPGSIPADMAAGYLIQEAAIGLWPDEIAGWKVGRIPAELQVALAADRVMGPVFAANVSNAAKTPTPVFAIPGGFAAVEAEYIYRMGEDAPAGKTDWTPRDALALVEEELVGVEFAGSPLASINILGPRVVAADFGNNAGLILGRPIPDWRTRTDDWPPCEAWVDGKLVGRGAPSSLPGGPAASLAFLMNAVAARGRPLKRGQLVTTGAASGIHDIEAGQTARITFGDLDEIRCIAHPAKPLPEGRAGGQGGSDHEHDDAGG
ncbi:2-keto-4-pentenoate hydratase [Phenylobacterium sp.]|uniref:2-keto-4-pentenoate hydratase n=1 Tax=Phenylobacterium sp. TaxID=1871053 RepID=UPI0035689795